ncbi:hypothetical protein BJ165DRAFT_1411303 [Panaeolus papilionaceus]|nr:hypothetical protein BJ165DRAFT_1411303 [Panaeolus papilionaceus]
MAVVVNETTPRTDHWWQKNVFGTGAQLLIVTVEQAFKAPEGHFSKLGEALRTNQQFRRRITTINVDKVHFIGTVGCSLYGLPAFRPAWGLLDNLKALLPAQICWLGFSATVPKHIRQIIENKILSKNHVTVTMSSNRRNTIYATHEIRGSINDLENY